jgi:hypothetical protein
MWVVLFIVIAFKKLKMPSEIYLEFGGGYEFGFAHLW